MKLVGILTLAAAAVVVASPVMAQQDTTHKTVAVAKKAAKKENLKALTKITKDSATKVALASLIQSVAAENKDAGITANIVLPGTMDTPGNRTPGADTSKWVSPQSVARTIVFLASDAASHVNAAAIPVSGFDV